MRFVVLVLLAFLCFTNFAHSQSRSTKITGIEIDGKTVRQRYQIYFLSKNKWVEAKRTPTGFRIPKDVRDEKYLTVQIVFGKYKLSFPNIHISLFNQDWTIGVDNPPFSEEFVPPDEAKKTKSVRYIKFEGDDIGRYLVIKVT